MYDIHRSPGKHLIPYTSLLLEHSDVGGVRAIIRSYRTAKSVDRKLVPKYLVCRLHLKSCARSSASDICTMTSAHLYVPAKKILSPAQDFPCTSLPCLMIVTDRFPEKRRRVENRVKTTGSHHPNPIGALRIYHNRLYVAEHSLCTAPPYESRTGVIH